MRKNTQKMVEEMFTSIKDVDTTKIGSNEEEMIAMFQEGNIKIPVFVAYGNHGINNTKAKIAYKSAKVDSKQLFAIVVTPEMTYKEAGVEVLATKTLALRNVINGMDAVTAEAHARAEVASRIERSYKKVNKYNRKVAIATEARVAKATKVQAKACKKVGVTNPAEEADKEFNFFNNLRNLINFASKEETAVDLADVTVEPNPAM